jgi:phage baseplate assembly protein V
VLAPSGDLAQAIAVPAVFQQGGAFPAPSNNPKHTLLQWDDGGFIRYERDTHSMFMHAPQRLTVTAGAEIVIQAPMVRVN